MKRESPEIKFCEKNERGFIEQEGQTEHVFAILDVPLGTPKSNIAAPAQKLRR